LCPSWCAERPQPALRPPRGMGRGIKKHGVKQAKHQHKYRPQDPASKPIQVVHGKNNAPPRMDEDVIPDSALASRRAFVPIERGAPEVADTPKSAKQRRLEKKRVQAAALAAQGKPLNTRNKKRKGGGEDKEEAEGAAQPQADAKLELPRQMPGESVRDYHARVNKSVKEHLQETRKKRSTERALEKKRAARVAKRERARAKKTQAKTNREKAAKKTDNSERAAHLDVVERPPILSDQALKSRSKLKSKAPTTTSLGSGVGLLQQVQAEREGKAKGSEFADYAAKVREAYAEMKKQRRQNGK